MIASRKLNSGIVRLVQSALDGVGDERTTVELPKQSLAQIAGELGRVGKLLGDERELAAIERLEARLESIFPKSLEAPNRSSDAGTERLPDVPVSLARAARLLSCSKTRTLCPAVETGAVRTIKQGKRRLIPPDELRRLAAEGILPPARPSRRRSRPLQAAPRDVSIEAARVLALQHR